MWGGACRKTLDQTQLIDVKKMAHCHIVLKPNDQSKEEGRDVDANLIVVTKKICHLEKFVHMNKFPHENCEGNLQCGEKL